jgi:broad specificity phosphatase PhoE
VKQILFVRHAESVSNAGGVTQPHADIPLSMHGWRQAQVLAGVLPASPSRIYCSPFLRAVSTAEPYSRRTGVALTYLDELQEFSAIDPELLQGMTGAQRRPVADAYWAEADPAKRMGERAETFAEFHQRVLLGIERLRTLEDGSVVFGHGIWLGLAYWMAENAMASRADQMRAFRAYQSNLPLPNGGCHTMRFDQRAAPSIRFEADLHRKVCEALSSEASTVREVRSPA